MAIVVDGNFSVGKGSLAGFQATNRNNDSTPGKTLIPSAVATLGRDWGNIAALWAAAKPEKAAIAARKALVAPYLPSRLGEKLL
jgi:hypothetical protein